MFGIYDHAQLLRMSLDATKHRGPDRFIPNDVEKRLGNSHRAIEYRTGNRIPSLTHQTYVV